MAERPVKTHTRPEDKAAAHFAALDIALSRGDYAAAAKAQQALTELGWDVRHRRPHAAPGGEGVTP
jgi:hypothetical protein